MLYQLSYAGAGAKKGGSIPAGLSRGNANAGRDIRGFCLVEAMVAVLVLSFGLLGIAGIQIQSLRSNVGSYGRSQATLAAYDIIDRMRANLPAVARDDYLLDPAASPVNPNIGRNCTTASCSVSQMAQTDVATWFDDLDAQAGYDLPGGTARITCSTSPCLPGAMVTVSVMWDEQRRGVSDTSCPAESDLAVHLSCFQVSVSP